MEKEIYEMQIVEGFEFTAKVEIKTEEDGRRDGYVTYYWKGEFLTDSGKDVGIWDSLSKQVKRHCVDHAEIICNLKNATLWSY